MADAALDADIRRADEDRWLASRFAPAAARARLLALYAVNYEIARTGEVVREPAVGDIRLAWWREALTAALSGAGGSQHPAVQGFAQAARGAHFAAADIEALIEARARDFDAAPFSAWGDLEAYVDATAGGVMRLALAACNASAPEALVRHGARAWGLTGLLRAAPIWRARGRTVLPSGADAHDLVARARAAHGEARALARQAPSEAFPALGYVALVPAYLKALEQGRTETALFGRQLRLIWASATGGL